MANFQVYIFQLKKCACKTGYMEDADTIATERQSKFSIPKSLIPITI